MSVSRILISLSVFLSLVAGLHYYLWIRLVRDAALPSPWHQIATGTLPTLALVMPTAFMGVRLLPRVIVTPLAWVGYIWMGAMFILFVLLLPAELVRLGAKITGGTADPERRLLLTRTLAMAVAAGGGGLSIFSVFTALAPVEVKRVRVPIPGLPEKLQGLRIIQLTDIHVGPTIAREFVEQVVQKTNAKSPDIIAITGDLVDGSTATLGEFVEPLRELQARYGVFFVTGNHEYYSGAEEWIRHVQALGIRVLQNERVTIEHEGEALDIAGVHDWASAPFGHGPDLDKALQGLAPDRKVVLLAHQPKQITEAAERGVALQLSGHTHGGQIFPFNYLVRLQQPFVNGLHRVGETALYVSPGTGYWGPPMRLGVPAEITEVVLERG